MHFSTIASLSLACLLATAAVGASAKDTSATGKPMTAQQQRMKDCNAKATAQSLKGDQRKTFMSTCLKGEPATASANAKTAQQQRMTTCNADAKAKALKGDQRKAFMKTCLSGAPAAH